VKDSTLLVLDKGVEKGAYLVVMQEPYQGKEEARTESSVSVTKHFNKIMTDHQSDQGENVEMG
jgi:hypothetical protein